MSSYTFTRIPIKVSVFYLCIYIYLFPTSKDRPIALLGSFEILIYRQIADRDCFENFRQTLYQPSNLLSNDDFGRISYFCAFPCDKEAINNFASILRLVCSATNLPKTLILSVHEEEMLRKLLGCAGRESR